MKTPRIFPTTEQVRQLSRHFSTTIPADWEDRNGHINVQFYVALYERGAYDVLEEVDVGKPFLLKHEFGMFDLEHHLNYLSETLVDDQVSTYNRVLSLNDKRFHGMYFIINDSRNRLSCTLEYITACVDLRTRRIAPFPQQLKQGVEQQLAKSMHLDWAAPVCGAMGV